MDLSQGKIKLFDVCIIGMGPTGAVLSALLGQRGLKVLVCDASLDIYAKPRAIALDHEIMRVLQEIGVAKAVEPYIEPFTNSEYFGVQGQLIKCMSSLPPPYPLGYVPSLVFSQPPFERVLRERVGTLDTVQVKLGHRLTSLTQDPEKVTLSLESLSGQSESFQAQYVVGCDGASSWVRQSVGLEIEDLGFDQPWLVIDVLLNDAGMAKLPKVSMQICEPKRPCTYVIGPQNHRRFEVAINEGEDPKLLQEPEEVWALLSRWMSPQDGVLWRQASYRFHALVAKAWRKERVLIAGDAAHQQPPFLGQGMCQGVRDAHNLAWKLSALIKGQATPALLDTYTQERSLHVKELTSRIKDIGLLVAERDEQKAIARDAALLREAGGVIQPMPRQNVQPTLKVGCLSTSGHAAVGTLFPQATLKVDGATSLMDDVLPKGWRLFVQSSFVDEFKLSAQKGSLQVELIECGGQGIDECSGVLAEWFSRMQVAAALVRPDHYVFGAFKSSEEFLAALQSVQVFYKH
jgi:3-(3-hydroxy-phenyl)propionate hydroxylase